MKSSIFAVCLLLIFKHTGTSGQPDGKPQWQVVFTNGTREVLLPCSLDRFNNVTWKFAPASAPETNKTCTVSQPKGICTFPELPNIKLADPDGYKVGNFSISFKATDEYAGLYSCIPDEKQTPTKVFKLIHVQVSVTPAKVISPGESVNLILQTSDESHFQNMKWNIGNNIVKGEGVEIQWKKNGALISASTRHKFDYRSLNISQFEQSDEGRYVFTIKNTRTFAFYSNKLKITEAAATTPTVSTTRSDLIEGSGSVEPSSTEATATTPTVSTTRSEAAATTPTVSTTRSDPEPFNADPEPAQNEDGNVVYTTIKLDAVPKSEPGATQFPEATIYAEVKASPSDQPTEEFSVL